LAGIALILTLSWGIGQPTAHAEVQVFPPWSFKPLTSALPTALVSPSVLEIGEQNELWVSHTTNSGTAFSLVIGGAATPIFKVGDAAPGGGTFVECCGQSAYIASPTVIYFTAPVDDGGTTVTRYFRWSNNQLESISVPAGVDYKLAVNDAHGRFLAKRGTEADATADYWITDGFLFNSTPVTLAQRTIDVSSGTNQKVLGITSGGAFLILEDTISGTFDCTRRAPQPGPQSETIPGQPASVANQTTVTRIFWLGGRSGTIASETFTSSGCVGNGQAIHDAVLNSAGDVFSLESTNASGAGEFTSILTQLWLYPGNGNGAELVAQGEQINDGGPYFFMKPLAVTKARQPIFTAATGPKGFPEGLFSGSIPTTDTFGGDFVQGFGQDGTAVRLFHFSENGSVLVEARLADNSSVEALGHTGTLEWANANGGNWGDATNWDPVQVPGQGDESRFRLVASYDVTVGTRQSGRSSVEAGSVVFQSADLTLIGPFSVGGAANFSLATGKMTANDLIVGHLPPANPATPPTARVQIANSGTVFTATAQTLIGQAGPGELFVNDGKLVSGEVLIGKGSPGTATVGGVNALWTLSSLNVGAGVTATLNIEHGGQVMATSAVVIGQADALQPFPALVSVDNIGAAPPALGNLSVNQLTVGDALPGTLDIQNGGVVAVTGLLQVGLRAHNTPLGDGRIVVEETDALGQQASTIFAFDDALFGMGNGARGDWHIFGGGAGRVLGNLHLGHEAGSRGTLSVSGVSTLGVRSQLEVGTDEETEACRVGFEGRGSITVFGGGLLSCSSMNIGGNGGSQGDVTITGRTPGGTPSTLQVDQALCVGGAPICGSTVGVTGTLTLQNGGVIQAKFLVITPAGHLLGQGVVTTTQAFIAGEVAPGFVLPVTSADVASADVASADVASAELTPAALTAVTPGVLGITGNVTLSNTAVIALNIAGLNSYDRLVITGTAQLDGQLHLNFADGFAPKKGDVFSFVQSTGTTGSFAQTVITGLLPDFDHTLTVVNGVVTLTALNDGVSTTQPAAKKLFLPMLQSRRW